MAHGQRSPSARSLFPVAPPVNGLNIFRMIVSPRSSHAAGMDMVGYDVAIIRELSAADAAFTSLGDDLSSEQLTHLSIRA